MRLRSVTSACALAVLLLVVAHPVAAGPLLIDVISATYTTDLSYRVNLRERDANGDPRYDTLAQLTTSNTAPLSEALVREGLTWASGDADMFAVSAFASAYVGDETYSGGAANAVSRSVTLFTPVESDTASIGLDFATWELGWFASGATSLTDVTTNEVIWDYSYIRSYIGNVPWDDEQHIIARTANVTLLHSFQASHVYALMLSTRGNAADDSNASSIQVSGFHAVPEPSTFLLLGTGLLGTRVWQRRRTLRQTTRSDGA